MYVLMTYDVTVLNEHLLTHITGEWPLPSMYELMSNHVNILTEYLITYTITLWQLRTM
jgi:hypothetical protein